MWRAFFMALGLNSLLLGAECFVLDRVELTKSAASFVGRSDNAAAANVGTPINANVFQNSVYQYQPSGSANLTARGRMFKPREWVPWSLLAVGAIIVMYTSAYARKTA